MAFVQSAGYVGSIASQDSNQFAFNTTDTAGNPTTLTGGTVQARNLSTNATFTTGVGIEPNTALGMHRIFIDTTDQGVWQRNYDYAIEMTNGSVGAVDITGMVVGQFSVAGKSDGRLYDQAVKVHAGVVTAVDAVQPDRVFTATFSGASQASDQYKSQVISFQPKKDGTASSNQGVGRAVLTSVGGGADTCSFTVQDAYYSPIFVGDEFKILPEERELTVYTANITAEWGGLDQPTPTDQYSVWWSANGNVLQNPSQVIEQMQFQVWRKAYPGPDIPIVNENLTPDAASGVYKWDEMTDFISANQGAFMLATALIDDIPVSFGRVLYNYT